MTYKPCTQCGKCCIKYPALSADGLDLLRWQYNKRDDILARAFTIHPFGADLWLTKSGYEAHRCPFLRKRINQQKYDCTCYEDRPNVCRGYPYDYDQMRRDHCEMIGENEWIKNDR